MYMYMCTVASRYLIFLSGCVLSELSCFTPSLPLALQAVRKDGDVCVLLCMCINVPLVSKGLKPMVYVYVVKTQWYYYFNAGGYDRIVKLWDLRQPFTPVDCQDRGKSTCTTCSCLGIRRRVGGGGIFQGG